MMSQYWKINFKFKKYSRPNKRRHFSVFIFPKIKNQKLLRMRLIMMFQWQFNLNFRMKNKINLLKLVSLLILHLKSLRIRIIIWRRRSSILSMKFSMRSKLHQSSHTPKSLILMTKKKFKARNLQNYLLS